MTKAKILIVSSNYYPDLSAQQLANCLTLFKNSDYDYQVEIVEAGAYEIPAVIQYYQQHQPFDGYIALGLLLKGSTDHYEFIWEHIKECFIQFSLSGLMIGNGIISATSMELLKSRVENNERSHEAFSAIDYLIRLKTKLKPNEKAPGA